jgi:hypothetical protein
MEQYERLARDLAVAHMSGDAEAVREVNRSYGTAFVADFHDPVLMQQRLTTWFAAESRTPDLALADARQMIAHAYGFQSWERFVESVARPTADPRSGPLFMSSPPPFYRIDWKENRLIAQGPQSEKDWETIFAVMDEQGIAKVEAGGLSDAAMKRLTRIDHVTHLSANSNALTDEGVKQLARMPQLLELEIGGPRITDRGLEALRHLTELRRFQSCLDARHLRRRRGEPRFLRSFGERRCDGYSDGRWPHSGARGETQFATAQDGTRRNRCRNQALASDPGVQDLARWGDSIWADGRRGAA